MDPARKELLISRISSSRLRFRSPSGRPYWLVWPDRLLRYEAQEVYLEAHASASFKGLFDDDALLDFLIESGEWDEPSQKLLDALPGEIENFKVALYKSVLKSNERKTVRGALGTARSTLSSLQCRRHSLDHISCAGVASMARARFLALKCLRTAGDQPVFADDDSNLIDQAVSARSSSWVEEAEMRELARTDPWKHAWHCRKAEGSVFGVPACDYTDDQTRLVSYSTLYESLHESPECPPDEVLDDDDLLDGYLIDQRRKREGERNALSADDLIGSEKVRNSQEIFLPVGSAEDARKVQAMNDPMAAAAFRRRMAHLAKHGTVQDQDMPDVKQRLDMAEVKLGAERIANA